MQITREMMRFEKKLKINCMLSARKTPKYNDIDRLKVKIRKKTKHANSIQKEIGMGCVNVR